MTTPTPVYIRLDLFPASVTSTAHGSGSLGAVRVIVTDAHIHIASDTPTGPKIIYSAVLESFEGSNKVGYTAITEDGETIEFRRASGCGCGSRLKGFRPFPGVPFKSIRT